MPLTVTSLTENVALITGAAAGIGEAIAHLFAENGARVFLLDRDGEHNQAVAASIREAGGWAQAFAGDVRQASEIAPVVQAAIAQFGQIDILIDNAGIYPRQTFLEMTEQQWDDAAAGLTDRGLLDADGALTAAGQEVRAHVERETDKMAAPP